MNDLAKEVMETIIPATKIMAKSIIERNCQKLGIDPEHLTKDDLAKLMPEIEKGVQFFAPSPSIAEEALDRLHKMV